jgi:hypothetical protein
MNSYLHQLASRALDAAPVLKPRLPSWFEPVSPRMAVEQETSPDSVAPANPVLPPPLPPPGWVPPPNVGFSDASRPLATEASKPLPPLETLPAGQRPTEPVAAALQPPAAATATDTIHVEREIHERHEVPWERRIEEKPLSMSPVVPEPRRAERRETSSLAMDSSNRNRDVLSAQMPPPPAPSPPRNWVSVTAVNTVHQAADSSPPPQRENRAFAVAALMPKSVPHLSPLPPPAPPPPPAIQVTIGRVEVRAVSAPPPTAAPRSRPADPMLSLDDYLKQKDGRSR